MRTLSKELLKDLRVEKFIAMIEISAKIKVNVNHSKGVGKCLFHLITKPENRNE